MTKMTMDANELRALADAQAAEIAQLNAALRTCMWALRQPIDGWKGECERKALDEARDTLSICDDSRGTVPAHYARAQPVVVPAGYKLVPVEPTQSMNNAGLSAVNQYGKRVVWETYKAMLAAAPAAPQAEEPIWKRLRDAGFTERDNRITCDECGKRFTPQFLPIHKCEPIDPHMIVAEDRFPDVPAEPKREPLHKLLEYADLSDDCQYGTLSASVVRDLVNEALGIGGSDAE